MSNRCVYLDTSAFMKLITPEPETPALRRFLRTRPVRVSASLLATEALRAAMRISQQHVAQVRRQLRTVSLVILHRDLLVQAGTLLPLHLRSLDAIHIAAALSLGDDVDEVVTYDQRMTAAVLASGLRVTCPS